MSKYGQSDIVPWEFIASVSSCDDQVLSMPLEVTYEYLVMDP